MSFSENLKEAIRISGLTTKELAQKTGINENTISSYLKTKSSLPDIEKGYYLAKALNVSVSFLVEGFQDINEEKEFFSKECIYRNLKTLSLLNQLTEKQRKSFELLISEFSSEKYHPAK